MVARLMAVMLVLAASGASAQTLNYTLDGLTSVTVIFDDKVSDGCWPRPEETLKDAELEFVRSKLSVVIFDDTIVELIATGLEITRGNKTPTGICTVAYRVEVSNCAEFKTSYGQFAKFGCYEIWSRGGGIVVHSKDTIQSEMNRKFVSVVRKFLYDLERDRLRQKEIRDGWPNRFGLR